MLQCQEVVKSSDIFVLLIHKRSGAGSSLLPGNVTPTFLEYKAAIREHKHVLVFVSPEIKENFEKINSELTKLYETYVSDHHRLPNSPYDPFQDWIREQLSSDGIAKQFLEIADPFVWAFLHELRRNKHWLYDFDMSRANEQAKIISAMLSTSLRSVVGLISEREQLYALKGYATHLVAYADYTLNMLGANLILNKASADPHTKKQNWSLFLEKGIEFLHHPMEIIQAPDSNPIAINTLNDCLAASLYYYKKKNGEILTLAGTTGEITAPDWFSLDEPDIFVVDAFKKEERIIAYREDKQTVYLAEPIGDFVLCLHFFLAKGMKTEQVAAYAEEIESAIMKQSEYFLDFLKLLIGGNRN